MVRFSTDLITGTGLVAHCREHYLWLSLDIGWNYRQKVSA